MSLAVQEITSPGERLANEAVNISSPQKLSADSPCKLRARERISRSRGGEKSFELMFDKYAISTWYTGFGSILARIGILSNLGEIYPVA